MSNSSLIGYTKISPYKTSPRNHTIDTITIHCMAGNLSVETCGNVFQNAEASSNYGISSDGKIAMYVEEKDRSWATSSRSNDNRAVTIEVANDGGAPDWHVSDAALESLIKLCADICQRNNIKELKWQGDKSLIGQVDKQNMTIHRWFANKACPGNYLYNKHSYIASEVNKILSADSSSAASTTPTQTTPVSVITALPTNIVLKVGSKGDNVKVLQANLNTVLGLSIDVDGVFGNATKNAVVQFQNKYGLSPDGAAGKNTITKMNNLISATANKKVQVTTAALNIRSGPGTGYSVTGVIRDKGVYTIVEQKDGFGKLKSGAGWISLAYTKKI